LLTADCKLKLNFTLVEPITVLFYIILSFSKHYIFIFVIMKNDVGQTI
jgi:hypothetical protein